MTMRRKLCTEPNGITNFNGTFAQVYMGGHAVDSAATSMPRKP
jgi:hypothetical protein